VRSSTGEYKAETAKITSIRLTMYKQPHEVKRPVSFFRFNQRREEKTDLSVTRRCESCCHSTIKITGADSPSRRTP